MIFVRSRSIHREPGPEVARVLMAYSVILIHAQCIAGEPLGALCRQLSLGLLAVARAAVPFFFVAAGYFLRGSCERRPSASPSKVALIRAANITFIYAVAGAVYFFLPYGWAAHAFAGDWRGWMSLVRSEHLLPASHNPIKFIIAGPSWHLWFLPALALAYVAFAVAVQLRILPWIFAAATAACLSVAIGRSYPGSALAAFCPLKMRVGISVSLFFLIVGWHLRSPECPPADDRADVDHSRLIAWTIFLTGMAVAVLERFLSHSAAPGDLEITIGTSITAIGLLLVSLQFRQPSAFASLAWLGPYTLQIYIAHMAVVECIWTLLPSTAGNRWDILFLLTCLASTSLAVVFRLFRLATPSVPLAT